MDDALLIIIPVAVLVGIAVIARLNIPILSAVLRWFWNISFTIAAFIPFCGWMSRFIITKGDKDAAAMKEELRNIGRETDDNAFDALGQSGERIQAELEERQEQTALEEEERRAQEEELRADAYRKYGTRDVHLNSDGSKVRVGNGDYVSTEEFKKSLR